ncbi:DUF5134 domain-containing protein [uncultured Amnibacterium sp.]|uniref:DUF5134 domain-containing protein n=1 Tax=uncultured Amnibacterium sp. TaxID=1631851 RepID=UPI0035CAFF5C
MGTPVTASVASILFGGLSLWFAVRVVAGRDLPDRVSNLLHLLMSAAMAAMPWPWAFPALPQVLVFSAGAFWYAGIALFRPTADAGLGVGHGRHGVAGLLYHAAMMLVMVWMAVAMLPGPPARTDAAGTAGTAMSAMTGGAAETLTGDAPWALAVSIAFGVAFVVAAVWLNVLLIREAVGAAGRNEVADLTASTAMAAGMAYSLLVLMT